jgi:hypothetical protein
VFSLCVFWQIGIITVLKILPVYIKMVLVSCPFLKDFVRFDETCVSASEVKSKILATWVSQIFEHFVLYYHVSAKKPVSDW